MDYAVNTILILSLVLKIKIEGYKQLLQQSGNILINLFHEENTYIWTSKSQSHNTFIDVLAERVGGANQEMYLS